MDSEDAKQKHRWRRRMLLRHRKNAFFSRLQRRCFFCKLKEANFLSFSRIYKLLSKLRRHRLGLVRVLPVSQHSIVLPKELHHGFVPHSGHWTGVIVEGRAEVDFAAEPMLKSTVPTDWNLK
jgi:hypothetical protein